MNKQILLIFGIVLINLASAQLIYPEDTPLDLKIPCTLDGRSCSAAATCNLSIQLPNSTYLVNNKAMTNLNNGDFNYSLTFSTLGIHPTKVSCSDLGQNGTSTFEIIITKTGVESTTSQGLIFIILIIVSLGLVFFFFIFANKTESNFMKELFILLSFVMITSTFFLSYLLFQNYIIGDSGIAKNLATTVRILGWMFFLIMSFMIVNLFLRVVQFWKEKKGKV